MFIYNKYSKWYYNIINQAKSREVPPNVYMEKHHIIPKSCGGDNLPENLVKLTAREHYVCHLLLPKMLTGIFRYKMVHAAWRMCNSLKIEYKITATTYAAIKEHHSRIMSGRSPWNKGKKNW